MNKKEIEEKYFKETKLLNDQNCLKLKDKFWLSKTQVNKLLKSYTYTEIFNWKIIDWKFIVKNLI